MPWMPTRLRRLADPSWVAKRSVLVLSKLWSSGLGPWLRWRYGDRTIVILGGHSGNAFDDNSRAFAVHLSNDPAYVVFWVYRREEVRRAARAAGLRTARRGAIRTEALIRASDVTGFSHGDGDLSIFPLANVSSGMIVYLGHGVWGLKRVERRQSVERRRKFDMTVAVSDMEVDIKASALGIAPSCIVRTGLPKHDRLVRQRVDRRSAPSQRPQSVLIFPTWRDWLQVKPSEGAVTNYLQAVIDIAESMPDQDPRGRSLKATFVLHTNIRGLRNALQKSLKAKEVNLLVSNEVDVANLIVESDYLVSDYSAIIWEFLIQGKPVARFVYDRPVYDFLIGGYPSIEHVLDPITRDEVAEVWKVLFTDQTDLFDHVARNVLPFSDGHSCAKLAREIDLRLADRR
jgi:hypothetical protein